MSLNGQVHDHDVGEEGCILSNNMGESIILMWGRKVAFCSQWVGESIITLWGKMDVLYHTEGESIFMVWGRKAVFRHTMGHYYDLGREVVICQTSPLS